MPGSSAAGPLTRIATPCPSWPALFQKPEAKYAAVYAPIAKNAT